MGKRCELTGTPASVGTHARHACSGRLRTFLRNPEPVLVMLELLKANP